ncbi:hypothetical protein CMI37_20255 [Candidatus Pacearchaeota archaeon]|nr:hypothetical protein [Candidatus Pacearchaeota archaeon]|tara:strand:+ start:466 stop:2211 length:1746 start_codon:yes stop_codon:yes gene_type:complete
MSKKNIVILVGTYIILFLIKLNYLNFPYFWDDIYPYVPSAIYSSAHGLTPFLYGLDANHPPVFFLFLALSFFLFGVSSVVAHLSIIVLSGLAIFFSYLIGKTLFNEKVGIISSLFFITSPLFLAQSSIAQITMMETAMFLMSFYFLISRKYFPLFIFSSLLVLTKEIFIFFPVLAMIVAIMRRGKVGLKNAVLILSPLIIFLLWVMTNKYLYGWFIVPYASSIVEISPLFILPNFVFISKYIFFDDFRWVITTLLILAPAMSPGNFEYYKSIRGISKAIILFVINYGVLFFISKYLSQLLVSKFLDSGIYFNIFNKFIPLFSLLIMVLILHRKKLLKFWMNEKQIILSSFVIIVIGVFSLFPWLPRYVLFIIPIYLILVGGVLSKAIRSKFILLFVIVVFVSLSLSSLTGEREVIGFWLENNYEFMDHIKVRQEATDYLVQNHQEKIILARYPEIFDLSYPWAGYVSEEKRFKLAGIEYIPFSTLSKDVFKGAFNIPFNDRRVTRVVNGDNVYEIVYINGTKIDWGEIEILYYSSQSQNSGLFSSVEELKTKRDLNFTLLKRFVSNKKYIEIYEVNGENEK